MAEPIQQTVTDSDRRHFDFIDTLRKISDGLSKRETAILKLYCTHIIPRGKLEKMKRPIDVFDHLRKLDKLNPENLDFLDELLRRIPRPDLVREVLRPFQPVDRVLPESQELLPGTSTEEGSVVQLTIHGHTRMVEETKDRYKNNLARIGQTKKSNIKFVGYKKHGSILVQFVVPQETTDLLRITARNSDPRLVFMGVTSLQIGREAAVEVSEEAMFHDIQSEFALTDRMPQDDIQVGCRVRPPRKAIPKCWSSLSALNLFSDALPLHLQIAESLEYQGFSYCLVQALVQKDQVRESQMRQVVKTLEVDEHTMMTMRSKLAIADNRAKTLEEENESLKRLLEQAQEEKMKAEEAATAALMEYTEEKYTGEKPAADSEKKKHEASARDTDSPEESEPKAEAGVPTGEEPIAFGGQGSEPGKFAAPRGVIVSPDNQIFIADMKNNRVQAHDIRGAHLLQFPTVVSSGGTIRPQDIAMDNSGHLWVVGRDKSADFLVQYTREGQVLQEVPLRDIGYRYRGVAVNRRNDEVLVAESDTQRAEILVFRPDGSLARRFGHQGVLGRAVRRLTAAAGIPVEARMEDPGFITVNEEQNIIISDWDAASIFVYDQTGRLLLRFGGLGSSEGQLRWPCGICTDSSGNIIVADFGNGRLEQFTSRGEHLRHIDIATRYGSPDGVAMGPMGHLVVTYVEKNTVAVFTEY
ncbi:PREDICTED: uncharacterized protein LOC109477711 [Branchiostoma belcheri]|uniref:Uncharacterized protein LOC109477711 n=1 Tax=Branchiostoma belcheri TaxID=7741 RepID=A0A6P4YZ79_BRABE|nr:PREDICTED: uncharacterized protein LOC109477711 [Branchiostoma belcheri]